MGAASSYREDFEWSYTQEPHATRRKEILAKYPQIKKLFGHDPNLKWAVLAMVITQVVACYFLQDTSWATIFIVAYCFGGVINHAMTLAIHEISHSLAFGHTRPTANRALALFGNTIVGVPSAVTFKKYHLDHHKFQGDDEMDVDIPHHIEAKLFRYTLGKFIWVCLQPFFYALRPLFVQPKPVTVAEIINGIAVFGFDWLIYYFFGVKALIYLIGGSLIAMGVHPVAGHFISEHYMFTKGYETYSYYGPLNWVTFNVGYHNEHHDFPFVPGCRLPEIRKIAPEYYDSLPSHDSWTRVIWDFITDPNVGLYSRVKRNKSIKSTGASH